MLRSTLFAGFFAAALLLLPPFCSGQTVSFVSGNGQLVCPFCPGLVTQKFAPLVVSVADISGNPLANTAVTWTVTPGTGSSSTGPTTSQTTTDATGQASFTLPLTAPNTGFSYFQTAVTATVASSTVQFVETTAVPANGSPGPPIFVSLLSPSPGQAYTGMAGTSASIPVQVSVFGINGGISGGLPGVAVQITTQGATPGPTLTCMSQPGQQPGTVLTDASGNATCTPVFGGTPGSTNYEIMVGGIYNTFLPGPLTVTPGLPSIIRLISGNGQSVNPGVQAPMPLVAEVEDSSGAAFPGAQVTWAVTQGSATLSNTVATSDSSGLVSTNVTAGGTAGPVQVTVTLSNTNANVVFSLTVNTVFNQLQIVSGNNQSAMQETLFADALVVQVNDQANSDSQPAPVPGITVNFVVTSGSATLSASSATTDPQGQAFVAVTAGNTPGAVVITASVAGSNVAPVAFNLTVTPIGPQITADDVVNAAGFQKQFISPCSLATIYGTGLATGIQGVVAAFLEPVLQLAGVNVTFAGTPAPILSVVNLNGQESVSVQVPCDVAPGMAPVAVTANGGTTTVMVDVKVVSPGIFQTVMSDGKSRPVMVRPDGSFVQLENPARPGEIIRAYATGMGQTTPALFTNEFDPLVGDPFGNFVPQILNVNGRVLVGVNNRGVPVVSAQYAYGLVGVYEVQFAVPSNSATGNDVVFAIAVYQPDGSAVFGNSTVMPIQ